MGCLRKPTDGYAPTPKDGEEWVDLTDMSLDEIIKVLNKTEEEKS